MWYSSDVGNMKRTLSAIIILVLIICQPVGHIHAAANPDDNEDEAGRQWNEPLKKADLLLFSAHADDEHLFFAGILPFCVASGIKAQVVYMTNHNDDPTRDAERLDGLWAVGITNYPVVSQFPDLYSESLSEALNVYGQSGFKEEDFVAFCVSNIRRFKPQVVVGHDIGGEYGHGTHSLSASALMKAVGLSNNSSYHAESYAMYGAWDVPKTYLHLWGQREITISIDQPLARFDGKTAFQVSQHGFSFHKSQHWMYFYRWLNGTSGAPITTSTQIRNYPPGKFGLYRTLVGDDSETAHDFFENVRLVKDDPEPEQDPGSEVVFGPDAPLPEILVEADQPTRPVVQRSIVEDVIYPLILILAIALSLILLSFVIRRTLKKRL